MIEIRTDIFPEMQSFFRSKEEIIKIWVEEAHSVLVSLFHSTSDFIDYLNSLKDPRDAEVLIRVGQFYLVAKEYQSSSYIKLIMLISATERIMRNEKYVPFALWIDKQEKVIKKEISNYSEINEKKFLKIIRALREQYFETFGAFRNVLSFFERNLTIDNKIKLIKSFRTEITDVVLCFDPQLYESFGKPIPDTIQELRKSEHFRIEENIMPYCYDWKKCFVVDSSGCQPSQSCALKIAGSEERVNEILKKVIKDIYQMRSDFVHDAKIHPLNESNLGNIISAIGPKYKPITIELTSDTLETLFEQALKSHFDKLRK